MCLPPDNRMKKNFVKVSSIRFDKSVVLPKTLEHDYCGVIKVELLTKYKNPSFNF